MVCRFEGLHLTGVAQISIVWDLLSCRLPGFVWISHSPHRSPFPHPETGDLIGECASFRHRWASGKPWRDDRARHGPDPA
jgi:hypothetical protein